MDGDSLTPNPDGRRRAARAVITWALLLSALIAWPSGALAARPHAVIGGNPAGAAEAPWAVFIHWTTAPAAARTAPAR
jgi:hypothetical protein